MSHDLDNLLTEVLAGTTAEGSQLAAIEQAFRDRGRFPFPARIVGTAVEVLRVELKGRARYGLTAVCRQGREMYRVSLADLIPGPTTVETARLLDAYRNWLGLPAVESQSGPGSVDAWIYRPVGSQPAAHPIPLGLQPMGTWDPDEHHWGDEGAEIPPLYRRIITAGPRPQFEMEQVRSGADDDWDVDPISDAVELHETGDDRAAIRLLKSLIQQDPRRIDAWVHLGAITFDTKGPKAAIDYYDVGVAVGEQALPDDFVGVLPRGFIDNRPFHRALHGIGLCAWRQRRWDDAALIFTNLAWIDGCQTGPPLSVFAPWKLASSGGACEVCVGGGPGLIRQFRHTPPLRGPRGAAAPPDAASWKRC